MLKPHALTLVAAALGLLAPLDRAEAQEGQNMWGGRIVNTTQVYAEAGYPAVEAGVRLPVASFFEVTPRVRFGYAIGTEVGPLALSPGVGLRAQILQRGPLSFAAIGAVPVNISFGDDRDTGVGVGLLHPGAMLTWNIRDIVDLDAGLQFRDDLYWVDGDVAFVGAVPLIVGIEGNLGPNLQLGLRLEAGPEFGARTTVFGPNVSSGVGAFFQAMAGVGFAI